MRRRLGCWLLAILVLGLAAGHVLFWYAARERPAAPDPQDEPARLFSDPSFDLALWLPYPHQNLAQLEDALGGRQGAEEWLGAVLRLAEVQPEDREVSIPSFGPFSWPPAREVAVAFGEGSAGSGDSTGTRKVRLAARIYPSLGWIGRAAGGLTGNPWLAGGEVRAFGGPARVSWQDGLWQVSGGSEGEGSAEVRTSLDEPALARLRVGPGSGSSELPAGSYRLARSESGAGFELGLDREGGADGEGDPMEPWLQGLAGAGVTAVWAEPGGIVVLFGEGGDTGRNLLPPAAVLAGEGRESQGLERPRLVHERLPSFLGGELERSVVGRWGVLATDDGALRTARELAAELPPPEVLPDRLLWVELPALRGFVEDVVELMEEVPLFPRRELARWRDLRTALAPLEGFDRLVLLTRSGMALEERRWRLSLTPPDPRSPD